MFLRSSRYFLSIFALCLLFFSTVVFPVDAAKDLGSELIQYSDVEIVSTELIVKVILASIIALAVGFVFIWVVKKKGYFLSGQMLSNEHDIKLLTHKRLDRKLNVALVEIDATEYVIAYSMGAISIVRHESSYE